MKKRNSEKSFKRKNKIDVSPENQIVRKGKFFTILIELKKLLEK